MNIFVLDNSPMTCARKYHDAHIRKMIVETAQMICTNIHYDYIKRQYENTPIGSLGIKNFKIINKNDSMLYEIQFNKSSTIIHTSVPDDLENLYKPTHVNHPCTKWVRKSWENFRWSLTLLECLLSEFEYRFNKKHKTETIIKYIDYLWTYMYFEKKNITEFPKVVSDIYQNISDPIKAYQQYYLNEKLTYTKNNKILPNKWTRRSIPTFINTQSKAVDWSVFD